MSNILVSPPLVRVRGLTKTYQQGNNALTVFRNLSLDIQSHELVAIVGPSGTGKSTLLHLLGGLDRPTTGTVTIDGFDISKLADIDLAKMRNQKVGFVFQFHHLLPEFSILENVMLPLLIRGQTPAQSARQATKLLQEVGLAARLPHRVGEISGGEAARVALARALVGQPQLLLADEPTGNLDTATGAEIQALLQKLHQTHGLTAVIVTHNERLAAACSRVLHLVDGKLTG
jgi:lipoprotein-releasing system ATP-binding protein